MRPSKFRLPERTPQQTRELESIVSATLLSNGPTVIIFMLLTELNSTKEKFTRFSDACHTSVARNVESKLFQT